MILKKDLSVSQWQTLCQSGSNKHSKTLKHKENREIPDSIQVEKVTNVKRNTTFIRQHLHGLCLTPIIRCFNVFYAISLMMENIAKEN